MLPIESLNKELQALIGLKFTATSRAADMECLKFGELIEDGHHEYSLHLQCPWRFILNGKVQKLSKLIQQAPKVLSVEMRGLGAFTLQFEGDVQLVVSPEPTDEEDYEYWRLLKNKQKTHVVVSSDGVEEL